jgi:hypothetical protein
VGPDVSGIDSWLRCAIEAARGADSSAPRNGGGGWAEGYGPESSNTARGASLSAPVSLDRAPISSRCPVGPPYQR